jgi:transcriptional regulator with XRE-family HTH domain
MNTKEQYGIAELGKDFGALTFGNALASYRLGEEKSQRAFAAFLDISPQSLCDIEKERRIPSPSRAAKIARKLGEPESFWVQLSLQDMLWKEDLNLVVSIA